MKAAEMPALEEAGKVGQNLRMIGSHATVPLIVVFLSMAAAGAAPSGDSPGRDIFPPVSDHVHGSTVVELPSGELLAAWFQGEGERSAEQVAIFGARLEVGEVNWSDPFLLADTAGFPDINPVLFFDPKGRLWLIWYTVIAHQWETSLLKYRISSNFEGSGPPQWEWQEVLHVKPGDRAERGIQPDDRFVRSVEAQLSDYEGYLRRGLAAGEAELARFAEWSRAASAHARGEDMMRPGRNRTTGEERSLGFPYFRRMGWQTRNKPAILESGRIILPLYSDGFDFSLMAMTDDCGENWSFSLPLVGAGNIQPAILMARDGSLTAYMRDNGPAPKRLHISVSRDQAVTWSPVRDSILPNPGSAADAVRLVNGNWVVVYNDIEQGRHSLAVTMSEDDGRSWPYRRHLERADPQEAGATRSHYPAVLQGREGALHAVYSHHLRDAEGGEQKTIRYARFNEEWIRRGETR